MTSVERKIGGAALQVVGAAMAVGGLVYLSLVVGTVIPFHISPASMFALFSIVGVEMFLGLWVIGWGAGIYQGQGDAPARCPRCDRLLDKQFQQWCHGCGWSKSIQWPQD